MCSQINNIDIVIDHINLKIINDHSLTSGKHCYKFGNCQANGSWNIEMPVV